MPERSRTNRTQRRQRPPTRVIDATATTAALAGAAPVAPPARGRLFYDFEIADAFLGGLPRILAKTRWVREHLPRETCIKIGRDCAWYAQDIEAYLESCRAGGRLAGRMSA